MAEEAFTELGHGWAMLFEDTFVESTFYLSKNWV